MKSSLNVDNQGIDVANHILSVLVSLGAGRHEYGAGTRKWSQSRQALAASLARLKYACNKAEY